MADELFINVLTDWLAERAQLAGTNPRRLWSFGIEEGAAPIEDVVSRLTPYPGGRAPETAPVKHQLVQCYTRHKSPAQAMAQAEKLYAALGDADGLPVCAVPLTGFLLQRVFNRTQPGQIGKDAQKRSEIIFNFECFYIPR